jgi:hypothetical protein
VLYKILADLAVIAHFFWIVFLIFGWIVGTRYRSAKIIHISGLVFALTIQIFNWYCPLTYLEVWLRAKHDQALTYGGSFIIHYIETIVYIEVSRNLIFLMSIFLLGFNVWLYFVSKKRNIFYGKNTDDRRPANKE